MTVAHLVKRQFVTDRIGLRWPIEEFEEARGLVRVKIVVDVHSAIGPPQRIAVVIAWQYVVAHGRPEGRGNSLDRDGLRSALASEPSQVYKNAEWPGYCG